MEEISLHLRMALGGFPKCSRESANTWAISVEEILHRSWWLKKSRAKISNIVWCDCWCTGAAHCFWHIEFQRYSREMWRVIKMFKDRAWISMMKPSALSTKTPPGASSVIFDLSLINWGGLTFTRDAPWCASLGVTICSRWIRTIPFLVNVVLSIFALCTRSLWLRQVASKTAEL